MLEKRVKSRFSQRVLHVSSPRNWTEWSTLARNALSCEVIEGVPSMSAFKHKWEIHVNVRESFTSVSHLNFLGIV